MTMDGVICDGMFEVRHRVRTLIVFALATAGEYAVEVVGDEP